MTKSIFARLMFALAAGVIAMHSIGCETTSGAGKDISNAGDAIHDSAERNK